MTFAQFNPFKVKNFKPITLTSKLLEPCNVTRSSPATVRPPPSAEEEFHAQHLCRGNPSRKRTCQETKPRGRGLSPQMEQNPNQ